jgi:hypothetical protein
MTPPALTPPTVVNIHKLHGVRPVFDLYIGRHVQYTEFTTDSKWCNPFPVKLWGLERCRAMFMVHARLLVFPGQPIHHDLTGIEMQAVRDAWKRALERWVGVGWDLSELTGQILGCWCIGQLDWCHGLGWVELWMEAFAP